MKSTARNSGLRRALFATGLAATAAAAVMSPDWSSVLKAQGYYGYVDLGIEVAGLPETLSPGDEVTLAVSVANRGPDTANRVRTIATAQGLTFLGGHGSCGATYYPQCALADTLAADDVAAYLLGMRVPADARNHVQFSASVASDDIEAQPGDEIVLLKRRIYVPLDLRSDIACARSSQGQERVARCSIRYSNTGSYGARQPALQASVSYGAPQPVRWSCESTPAGLCAAAQANAAGYVLQPLQLPAAASVTFFADIPLRGAQPLVALSANASLNPAMGETDLQPGNNSSGLTFEPSLFVDGFDAAP